MFSIVPFVFAEVVSTERSVAQSAVSFFGTTHQGEPTNTFPNVGTARSFTGPGEDMRPYWTINISNLTSKIITVINTTFAIYIQEPIGGSDSGTSAVWYYGNDTIDDTLHWNNQPCGSTEEIIGGTCNSTIIINMTHNRITQNAQYLFLNESFNERVQWEVDNDDGVFIIIGQLLPASQTTQRNYQSANVNFWPFLNITYDNESAVDTTPPEITHYNMTSEGNLGCTNWNIDKQNPCKTTDKTPTVKINLSESSFCAISTFDYNYTNMIADDPLTNTSCTNGVPGTFLTCTLPITKEISGYGLANISIGCKDANGNENKTSTSGRLLLNVTNAPPQHSTPLLSSSLGTNFTNENLTCFNQSTSDPGNDPVKNIYNWFLDNTPIAVLNMPFEGVDNTPNDNAKDYSGYGNNGVENGGIVWSANAGYDGKGAYEFDGVNNTITILNFSVFPT